MRITMKHAAIVVFCFGVCISLRAGAGAMVIDSLDGPVTANEIQSFKSFVNTLPLPTTSWGGPGKHNEIMDGVDGTNVEGMGLMYEVSGDVDILNRMIVFVDRFVSLRNDLPGGSHRPMWDGIVHKTWLPSFPEMRDNTACGDHEDTVGHICYCAELILKNRDLWDKVVPDGDPNGYGKTYKERAIGYIKKCDENDDDFSLPIFIDVNNRIRPPQQWPASAHNVDASNIQAMWRSGFQRSEECHKILGDQPDRVAKYHAINKVSIDLFLSGLHPYTANGKAVVKWHYFAQPDKGGPEASGLHGAYDILGIVRAYRNGTYGVPQNAMTALADTLMNVIYKGDNKFSEWTDGTGPPVKNLLGYWMLLAQFNPDVFKTIATADIPNRGGSYEDSSAYIDAVTLWVKYHRFTGDFPK